MESQMMSKRTIAVLLVLSILFSVFGTLAVIDYIAMNQPTEGDVQQKQSSSGGSNAGGITLSIVRNKEASQAGYVTLDIKKVE
jgi:hypothetical protein